MGLQGKRAAEHQDLERLILIGWEAAWVLEEREVMSQADQQISGLRDPDYLLS